MWTTNTQSASVIQLRAGGNQTQKEAVILKQLFCDWSTLLPSPRLSNKAWSLFPHILQNVLMRPNPFNSCPNCQSYGYNCVWLCACACACVWACVCLYMRVLNSFSFSWIEKGRAAVSSGGEITSKTSKDPKRWSKDPISDQMSIISHDQPSVTTA